MKLKTYSVTYVWKVRAKSQTEALNKATRYDPDRKLVKSIQGPDALSNLEKVIYDTLSRRYWLTCREISSVIKKDVSYISKSLKYMVDNNLIIMKKMPCFVDEKKKGGIRFYYKKR